MTLQDTRPSPSLVRLAGEPADFARYGLAPLPPAPFEDGLRTDPHLKGVYEWWYFDGHLDDGSKLVVLFATKDPTNPTTGLKPLVTINLDLPDGRSLSKALTTDPSVFAAATDTCDVAIGENRFSGDLHRYRIVASIENVSVDVTLEGRVPAWRPKTGHTLFGTGNDEKLFAWFVGVPNGRVSVDYRVDGDLVSTQGIGYHDHNWGDAPLMSLVHDWYWGRAQVGPYSLIAAYTTATEKYAFEAQPVFVLTRDGEIIADDESLVTFSTDRVHTDEQTGKPVADVTTYHYDDGPVRYVVAFERKDTILRTKFVDQLPFLTKILAKLARFDGAYLRFVGTLTLRKYVGGELVEELSEDKALWELMYFGHARPPAA